VNLNPEKQMEIQNLMFIELRTIEADLDKWEEKSPQRSTEKLRI
jgi:hypothetical protein